MDLINWVSAGLERELKNESAISEAAQKELRSQEDRLARQLEVLYADRLDGRITASEYDSRSTKIRAAASQTKAHLSRTSEGDNSHVKRSLNFITLTQKAAHDYSRSRDVDQKRELAGLLFDSMVLTDDHLTVPYSRQAKWVRENIATLNVSENGELEPPDSGFAKQKGSLFRGSFFYMSGMLDMTRTHFMDEGQ